MNETFATIIYSAPMLDVKEIMEVAAQLSCVLDEKFVKECKHNKDLINALVASNIEFKKPEDGEIGLRLAQLSNERNCNYQPSPEMLSAVNGYCQRKGIPVPAGFGGMDGVPQYVP
jgi:hypothetical protein